MSPSRAPFAAACLLVSLSLAMSLNATCAIAADPSEVKEYKLSNGLEVLLMENHNAPVASFYVVYRVGSKNERPGITGISHLLEHMMFKTTKKHPLGEFDHLLQNVGAQNNASTWQDRTMYFETVPSSALDLAIELESDRMRGALMLGEDRKLEMPVVRNELEQDEDNPEGILFDEMLENAYKAHPYGVPTIGWTDDVEGITDQDIKEYYDRWYQPDNAFIVVVGDFNSQELFEKISKAFGALPASGVTHPRLPIEPQQHGERRFVLKRAGDVDYLQIVWHIPDNHNPDAYALQLLGSILGRGRTSRFYPALVDSGLCTGADASSEAFSVADPGLFEVGCSIAPGQDSAAVEGTIYSEIQRVIDSGVTADELARAKKQERVNYVFAADSLAAEARYLINFETYCGDWKRMYEYLPGLEAVTSEDIQRVAAQYLIQDNRTVGLYDGQPSTGAQDGPHGGTGGPGGGHGAPHYKPESHDADDIDAWSVDAEGADAAASRFAQSLSGGEASQSVEAVMPADYASVSTLSNGLTLIVRESHENSSVNLSGVVRCGSVDEPDNKPGLASMAIAMLSRGTEKYSKQQLAEMAENDGIRLGFGAGRESFGINGRCLSEDYDKMMDLLEAELLSPTFPQDELERLRQQTLAGLLEANSDTGSRASLQAKEALYGAGHPYARMLDGTEDSVKSISADDLRSWYKAHCLPEGAIICIVGDVDAGQVRADLEQRLAGWQGSPGDRSALLARSSQLQTPPQAQYSIFLPEKRDVTLLWSGPAGSAAQASIPARQMANYIFGGGFTTRLNNRLRVNEGLTYGSRSGFDDSLTPGTWSMSADVNPVNVNKAIASANDELSRYFSSGPTDDELSTARAFLSGSYEVRLASKAAVAGALTDAYYRGLGVEYVLKYPELVAAVSPEEVRAVIKAAMDPGHLVMVEAGTLEGQGQAAQ